MEELFTPDKGADNFGHIPDELCVCVCAEVKAAMIAAGQMQQSDKLIYE